MVGLARGRKLQSRSQIKHKDSKNTKNYFMPPPLCSSCLSGFAAVRMTLDFELVATNPRVCSFWQLIPPTWKLLVAPKSFSHSGLRNSPPPAASRISCHEAAQHRKKWPNRSSLSRHRVASAGPPLRDDLVHFQRHNIHCRPPSHSKTGFTDSLIERGDRLPHVTLGRQTRNPR